MPSCAPLPSLPSCPEPSRTVDRWEKDIATFETADKMTPPQKGGIVFVGSSTIRRWDTASYFPDLKIINRGFGGSEVADAVRYVDRIVIPTSHASSSSTPATTTSAAAPPRKRSPCSSSALRERFREAPANAHPSDRGQAEPPEMDWIDRMRMSNAIMRAYCERDDRIGFIDFDTLMLGWDEKPRRELFVEDGLHLSPQGYQLWTTVLRPWLTAP